MAGKAISFVRSNVVGFVALFVALGGVGYAATGGFVSAGKLRACVSESGSLTLLRSGKTCKKGQKTVTWNQTGPQGPPGTTGASGATGATGASGPAGPAGTSATSLWAKVDREGKLLAGQGVTSAKLTFGPSYEVTFGRDVSNCAAVATENSGPRTVIVSYAAPQGNTVSLVLEEDEHNVQTTGGFSLALYC